jgi:hypothetical protein
VRRRRSVVALALCLLLSGCARESAGSRLGAGPAPVYAKGEGSRFVLRPGDLPAGYKNVRSQSGRVDCDSGYLANRGPLAETEQEAALKQQILLLGPQSCNLSTYERTEGGATTGLQVLAVVFRDDRGASSSLPMLRRSFVEFSDLDEPAEDIARSGLGDESMSGIRWRPQTPVRGQGLPFPEVHIWRLGNVAVVLQASVTAGVTADDVVEIGGRVTARAAKK